MADQGVNVKAKLSQKHGHGKGFTPLHTHPAEGGGALPLHHDRPASIAYSSPTMSLLRNASRAHGGRPAEDDASLWSNPTVSKLMHAPSGAALTSSHAVESVRAAMESSAALQSGYQSAVYQSAQWPSEGLWANPSVSQLMHQPQDP